MKDCLMFPLRKLIQYPSQVARGFAVYILILLPIPGGRLWCELRRDRCSLAVQRRGAVIPRKRLGANGVVIDDSYHTFETRRHWEIVYPWRRASYRRSGLIFKWSGRLSGEKFWRGMRRLGVHITDIDARYACPCDDCLDHVHPHHKPLTHRQVLLITRKGDAA